MCEILSPAGDMKCLKAAVQSGADAVYIGGTDFSARKYAGNFSRDEISEAVKYAHLRGVKVYVTVNTMLLQSEMMHAMEFAVFLRNAGADAVITADMGLAGALLNNIDIPVHASTQMCVHNAEGALMLKKAGFSRVVTARELCIDEIKKIADTGIETEVFVHGALCSSVSGLCLMSSFIGQRSGNRGACAQPCRLPYKAGGKESYCLSTADLCAVDYLGELIDAGVVSFKIEGRMKPPVYVAGVTAVYAEAVRRIKQGGTYPGAKKELERYYNRTFTDGYLRGITDVSATDRPDNRSSGDETFIESEKKYYTLNADILLETGKKPEMTVTCGNISVKTEGDNILETAKKNISVQSVKDSVSKTGGTPFEFGSVNVNFSGNPFISKSALNALRRSAFEKFENAVCGGKISIDNTYSEIVPEVHHVLQSVYVESSDAGILAEAVRNGAARVYYAPQCYDDNTVDAAERIYDETGTKPYIKLPPFLRDDDMKAVYDFTKKYSGYFDGILCGNFSQLKTGKNIGRVVADYTFNVANTDTTLFLKEEGFDELTLSSELSFKDILHMTSVLPCEMVAFGYLPLMWFAHDVPENLTDRKGYKYGTRTYDLEHKLSFLDNPVLMFVHETNRIYNKIDAVRLIINDKKNIRAVSEYKSAVDEKRDVSKFLSGTSQGHMKRGV